MNISFTAKMKEARFSVLHYFDRYDIIKMVLLCWLGRAPTFMVPINPPFANSQHLMAAEAGGECFS